MKARAFTLVVGLTAAMVGCCACGSSSTVRAQHTGRSSVASADKARARKPLRILQGLASYYSDALAGRKTANGERYDPSDYTAASRDLPFDTKVRVIRRDTGARVVVRINDRGPFGDRRRILDLSRAAARDLGFLGQGVVRVRVEVLELGPGKPPQSRTRATKRSSR